MPEQNWLTEVFGWVEKPACNGGQWRPSARGSDDLPGELSRDGIAGHGRIRLRPGEDHPEPNLPAVRRSGKLKYEHIAFESGKVTAQGKSPDAGKEAISRRVVVLGKEEDLRRGIGVDSGETL